MARPKAYNDEQVAEIVDKLAAYISKTPIPIIAEFAYQNDIPRHALYDNEEFKPLLKECVRKSGKCNKKKYKYSVGDSALTARYHQDIRQKLKVCMTARIRHAMKDIKSVSANNIRNQLGYSIDELREHLESRFQEGMSWDNHGRDGWHIDHVKPVSMFDYNSVNDSGFRECWALANLQPLWAADNIRKGCHYVEAV